MAESSPRLLVTLPRTPELDAALRMRLPKIPFAYAAVTPGGPWPGVEAMLTGTPERELSDWEPDRAPNLRFVQRIYTGLDDFPFRWFPERVMISGNGGGFAPFVAEHGIALILALAKWIVPNFERVRSGVLRPVPASTSLIGKTVLLLGFGTIADAIATRLRPFGVRVEGLNRSGSARTTVDRMYAPTDLRVALGAADVVVDCRPLTRSTRGSIGRRELQAMRPGAILVNVGRAATVDEAALYDHLKTHSDFRAGFDPWWEEDFDAGRLRTRHPLGELPNFVGSPHNAGIGPEVRAYALDRALDNLGRFFRGEPPWFVADRAEYVEG